MLTVVTAFDDPSLTGTAIDEANLEYFAAEEVEGRCVIMNVGDIKAAVDDEPGSGAAVVVMAEPEIAAEWRARLTETGVLDESMYLDLLRHRLLHPVTYCD